LEFYYLIFTDIVKHAADIPDSLLIATLPVSIQQFILIGAVLGVPLTADIK